MSQGNNLRGDCDGLVHEGHVTQNVARVKSRCVSLLQEEFYCSLLSAFGVDEVRQQLAAVGLSQLKVREHDDRYLDVWGVL